MTNTVANTIAQQIGGLNRVAIMTGAKNFVSASDGLTFQLPRNVHVKITLNEKDLYDVKVCKFNARAMRTTLTGEDYDVYAVDLIATLERLTDVRFKL